MTIDITNLRKSFGKNPVLKGIDVAFDGPGLVFLIGPNASGKTTLFKSILGLVLPQSGTISYNGQELSNQQPHLRHAFGYMPQVTRFPAQMTAQQLIDLTAKVRQFSGQPDVELMEAFGLNRFLNQPIMTLSGGTRQKVMASLAFYFHPEVVILDEPTAGLDPESSTILLNKIFREQAHKLMIMSTHILYETNRMGKRAVYLKDGELIFSRTLNDIQQAFPHLETHLALVEALKTQQA
jgi:Cu-processing system ATP-binding protein